MAKKELDVGISEDGQDFTIVVDDDTLGGIQKDKDQDDDEVDTDIVHEEDVGDEEESEPLFDKDKLLKDVPEEHKKALLDVITNVEGLVSSKLSEMDAYKAKAEMSEVLLNKLTALKTSDQQTSDQAAHATEKETKPKLEESFQFEEKDYYAPFFKKMISVIEGIEAKVDGVQTNVVQNRQNELKSNVRTFFASNKVERPVIAKMDDIAQEYGKDAEGNFVMYKNLPKLLQMAKVDLGMPLGKPKPKIRPKVNPRKQVEAGSLRKSASSIVQKPAGTMIEAFDQTLEQLNE